MLKQAEIEQAARDLHEAERERRQIRPLTIRHPDMDLADAYAVQDAWMAIKLAEGRKARGRKIGLTSRAMQQAMQINEPDTGLLLDDMFFDSGAPIDAAQFTDPRLEVELAFILGAPLSGADLTLADVLNATSHVMPAVEIIAARSFRVDPQTSKPRTVRDTMKRCRPPRASTTPAPGLSIRWNVLATMIRAPSPSSSSGVIAFTVAWVPTGMNAGSSTAPRANDARARRASPSLDSTVNEYALTARSGRESGCVPARPGWRRGSAPRCRPVRR